MHYPHVVTFTAPVEFSRTPSGQVLIDYEPVEGLTDLPARIIPQQMDDQGERMVIDTERFVIVVRGDREVTTTMRAVSDYLESDLGVIKVERPVLYRSELTRATLVTVEKVRATAEVATS